MKQEKILDLLTALNARNVTVGDKWVNASCLFAPWTHKGGADRNPSFGISIEPEGKSHFNCQTGSCAKHGDINDLLFELMHYVRTQPIPGVVMNLKDAFSMIDQENDELYYDHSEIKKGPAVEFEAFPEWFLDGFPTALSVPAASSYLLSRGMTDMNIRWFDVRADPFKQRVVFPYRNRDGELAGLRGRSWDKTATRPHYDYPFNGRSNTGITWFNEHKCDTTRPLVVVEGQFDCWGVWRVHTNVVGNLSSSANEFKLDRLLYYPSIVFMYDADEAGKKASDKHYQYLRAKGAVVHTVPWQPEHYAAELDPGKLPQSEIQKLLADFI